MATLEFSLMAQGVERDSIYPLDIERALSSLDIIADHVPVWWEAGNRTNELLTDGAVLLSSGWNRRFHNAKAKGMPIEMVWEEGILSSQWRVIPKGAPHVDLARKFIAFATTAEPQAEFARLIPYGPVSFKALDLLSAERLQVIPTSLENLPRQMIINDDWWVENMDSVRNRWKEWRSAE